MLKFSPANAKTHVLAAVPSLAAYLSGKRKIYSLDLLSGFSCPFAHACLSKAVVGPDGRRVIKDGPHTQFRCFSASQEAQYPNVSNKRKHNFDELRAAGDSRGMFNAIVAAMPANLGICRIHVAGDFFNQAYFDAWVAVASAYPERLFYAYTKSLTYWLARREQVNRLPNFVLTASFGGRLDSQIAKQKLRYSKVVFSKAEAESLGLAIDHDDSHAADPTLKGDSFALLLHGTQPKGSNAGKALSELKGEGSYSRYGIRRSIHKLEHLYPRRVATKKGG